MKLDDMLKLNNKVASVEEMEEIIESEYFTWFKRDIGTGIYEGYASYTITLQDSASDFEGTTIKVYMKR